MLDYTTRQNVTNTLQKGINVTMRWGSFLLLNQMPVEKSEHSNNK